MTNNRFAQLRDTFDKELPKKRKQSSGKEVAAQKSPDSYDKKGRYPFSLHYDVRYKKLEELVSYHKANSASDYLEKLIIQEWNKLQRKLKD